MIQSQGFLGALRLLCCLCALAAAGCGERSGGAAQGTAGAASGNVSGLGGQSSQGAGGAPAQAGGAGGNAGSAVASGAGGLGVSGTAGVANGGGAGGGTAEPYPKPATPPPDEDGAQLWLRYPILPIPGRLAEYKAALTHVVKAGSSETLQAAQAELVKGIGGLTGTTISVADAPTADGAVVLGTPASSSIVSGLGLGNSLTAVGDEGYLVQATQVGGKAAIVVAANSDIGVLYGAFALLRHLQTHQSLQELALSGTPKIKRRILDHWDNLDGTIERGFAGKSLWNWSSLPGTLSQRYTDYARANASIGINGVVLNNVNANAQILTSSYLDKVAALAKVFRPYGITVYLSAQFGAPQQIGGLATADPLDSGVKKWWTDLATTIYQKIPDFGGFLVKANSEGQPGPADYNRTHADGANMLAAALAPHNGIVMWRAFVYGDDGTDRAAQPYREFTPLDGKFAANVVVQVKNGPIDFQPREMIHPLFGAMPSTAIGLELQVTKEYLGEDTHLAYLGTLYEEVLKFDTSSKGQGSTVARVIDGSLDKHALSLIAGVANVGSDTNWAGSDFNQANWYVFGRMAWDPDLGAEEVADEWIRQTLSNDPAVVAPVKQMMMASRQNLVNYMEPLGLLHMMGSNAHYGPAPWVSDQSMLSWNPTYYHRADAMGIGFDRTPTGTNMVAQYAPAVRDKLSSLSTVPDDFLLFFQRASWDDKLASSGRTIWEELVYRYSLGVDAVQTMRDGWKMVEGRIDGKRYDGVTSFLQMQHYEARWWRDACLLYFGGLSKHTVPSGYAMPLHDVTYYQNLLKTCPADATKPRCPAMYTGSPSPAILK